MSKEPWSIMKAFHVLNTATQLLMKDEEQRPISAQNELLEKRAPITTYPPDPKEWVVEKCLMWFHLRSGKGKLN